jgi:hypothetical protein
LDSEVEFSSGLDRIPLISRIDLTERNLSSRKLTRDGGR